MDPVNINGDWLQTVKDSIPDHSKDIKLNIDSVINRSGLDPVDAHAIAYVSAIASGNGGLAFEIEHNSPLFTQEAERNAAKTAASLMAQNNIWYPFVEMAADESMKGLPAGLRMNAYATHGGVSKKKFEMYSLAASIIGKCHFCVKAHYDTLKKEGMTTQELMAVGRIASVVNALSKTII
jgi:lipoyl-dependent peroxiredoxin subunit D